MLVTQNSQSSSMVGQEEEYKLLAELDKLIPYHLLFLLISEVLSALIARLHEKRKFEGFIMGKDRIHVSILQFANDTLISCKYEDEMIENLRKTIELFAWCFGQKVSWEKSALCGINVDDNKLIEVAARLNCKVDHLPNHVTWSTFGWLSQKGLLFGNRSLTNCKLDKWRRYNLSREGRATLCKLALSNLPTYYMSSFLMLKKVISIME